MTETRAGGRRKRVVARGQFYRSTSSQPNGLDGPGSSVARVVQCNRDTVI